MHGDCIEQMEKIPDGSVDMVLCDLPYGITDYEWDKMIDGQILFGEYKRLCKQNANVALFCNVEFAKYLMSKTYESEFSHALIWVKDKKTRYLSVKHLPMNQYEVILVFRINKYANKHQHKELRKYMMKELEKSGMTVKQIEEEIGNRSAHHWFRFSSDYRIPTQEWYCKMQELTGCFERRYEDVKEEFLKEKKNKCTYNGKNESDVLKFSLDEERVHPTQKPVSLLEYIINMYSNSGETVLDNCMGSGSTGVACANTGRNFIGIEKDDKYYEIARCRIDNAIQAKQIKMDM